MSKYVDLDLIIDHLEIEWGYEGMREELYDLPTADVEEVVHCKHCKYCEKLSGKDKYEGGRFSPTDLGCTVRNEYVYADDYCSNGRRCDTV